MIDFILNHESSIRLSVFFGGVFVLALWEYFKPKRKLTQNKLKRWLNNIALIISSTVLVKIIVPAAAVGAAYLAEEKGWGFFNYVEMNYWVKFAVTFVLLDLIIYLQHLNFHEIPILWRIHRVHHSDRDCDVTTGIRFHPIEIVISIFIKIIAIIMLGVPVLAVIVFELTLNFMSMLTHSNIYINKNIERVMRWFIVTPDMHRIHHSTLENEANSNFSFNISLWDRLFGTYMALPEGGHQKMNIGLDQFNGNKWQTFFGLLYTPFVSINSGYSINRRDTRNADELRRINDKLKAEIIENKERTKQLIIAKKKANEANRVKSEFLANMSHELRTPMHAILCFSSMGIENIDKDEKNKLLKYYKNIHTSGERLLFLVNDLLDLSKLESGAMEFSFVRASLHEVIDEVISETKVLAEDKGVLICYTPVNFDTTAYIDRDKISQVLFNFISNAIKFTGAGEKIKISISEQSLVLGRSSDNVSMPSLSVSVIDQGVGIPEDELELVFDKFVQSSKTKTNAGGTGLGLSISKEIILNHQGIIYAANNLDKGTSFTFVVPVEINNQEKRGA